jgi:hypothetical protein
MKGEEGFFLAISLSLSLSLSLSIFEKHGTHGTFSFFLFLLHSVFSTFPFVVFPYFDLPFPLLSFGFLFVTLSVPFYAVRVLFGAYSDKAQTSTKKMYAKKKNTGTSLRSSSG